MTNWEVVRWWEVRRIAYTAILFVIGIVSILGMEWLMGKVISSRGRCSGALCARDRGDRERGYGESLLYPGMARRTRDEDGGWRKREVTIEEAVRRRAVVLLYSHHLALLVWTRVLDSP